MRNCEFFLKKMYFARIFAELAKIASCSFIGDFKSKPEQCLHFVGLVVCQLRKRLAALAHLSRIFGIFFSLSRPFF